MAEPTYIFRDGNVYTLVEGKVVASVKEADFQEPVVDSQNDPSAGDPVEMPPPPADIAQDLSSPVASCPQCGGQTDPSDQFCAQCGSPLNQEGGVPGADLYGMEPPVPAQPVAHTITTPNGLTGKVLGRTAGLWGDQVTVRLENGTIKQLHVAKGMEFTAAAKEETSDPHDVLRSRLDAPTLGDRESLVARVRELSSIRLEAKRLVSESSDVEAEQLSEIITQAHAEALEAGEALQHLAELEGQAFEPVAPVEALPANTSGDPDWFDKAAHEVLSQASTTDFTKLMDEGPEAVVASTPEDALEDSATTREIAARWIRTFTAGTREDVRDTYENVFFSRVENERQRQLETRKEVKKEASVDEEPYTGPSDALFL